MVEFRTKKIESQKHAFVYVSTLQISVANKKTVQQLQCFQISFFSSSGQLQMFSSPNWTENSKTRQTYSIDVSEKNTWSFLRANGIRLLSTLYFTNFRIGPMDVSDSC